MAVKRQTWLVSVILMGAGTRILASEPIVRFISAPASSAPEFRTSEFLAPTTSELIDAPPLAGASVARDEFLCDGCNAPGCVTGCKPRECCCPRISCCCTPCCIVSSEAMFLRRRNAREQFLAISQSGAPLLSTSDFNDDYTAIPRLQVIRQGCYCNGWDVTMFGLSSFDSDALTGASPQYVAPGILLPSTAPGTVFRTDYQTNFHSFELNYRRTPYRLPFMTLIAGFRWLELSDELNVDQAAPVQRDLFAIDTDNHMYGFQTGYDAALWTNRSRFYVDTSLRAGIFYNRADQTTHAPFFTPLAPLFVDQLTARANHTSFFGELGLHAVYHLTNHISIRAGYRLMWLEGAALAPNQIPVNSLVGPTGISALDTGGSLFFDGATVGAFVTF